MNSIVKFCSSCDEVFAKSIDLCPNCASTLRAFRMESLDEQSVRELSNDLTRVHATPAAHYAVTVITASNGNTRNFLFAGALFFVVTALFTALVVNLFSKDLDLGSINNDVLVAVIVDNVPLPIEEAPEQKKDKGKGGGGGGNNDPVPASQGDRAPMRTNPEFAPSVSMEHLTNPSIPIQMAIQGPVNERIDTSRYGVKLGGDTPSDGPGSNGGQGTGRNLGQGPGEGPGAGPGSKGGLGGGPEGGVPRGESDVDPPSPTRGVTIGLRILSKPRPGYTDEARQSLIQGTIILRVTFNASGEVGKIDVVKGLPGGLTERAIAAAKKITFEPVTVNGKPITVTKQIEYAFYIY
jgi:TonB family protein